jgi:hypothetical protein
MFGFSIIRQLNNTFNVQCKLYIQTWHFNIACQYPYLIFFPDRIRRVQVVVVSGLQEELREEEELLLSPQEGTLPGKAGTQKATQGDDGHPH